MPGSHQKDDDRSESIIRFITARIGLLGDMKITTTGDLITWSYARDESVGKLPFLFSMT